MALTDAQLITEAGVIRNETASGANTANRVGGMLEDIINNKINDDKISIDGTFAANLDTLVPSQKATKTYVANQVATINANVGASLLLKENTANKSIGPLGVSVVLFPTESSVSTAIALKEDIANKSTNQSNFIANGLSATKYPSNVAIKGYVDSTTAGLLRDAGNFTPSPTSPGALYPTVGTGPAGAVALGDTFFINAAGYFGIDPVTVGASIRALIAAPAVPSNWSVLDASIGIVPEDSANKSDDGTFNAGTPSHVQFPTQFAVATYLGAATSALTLQAVLGNGHTLTNGRNFQGDNAGVGNTGFDVNAFGQAAGYNNTGTNVNGLGVDAAHDNIGASVNAMGISSAQANTGSNINAFGSAAANGNTGSNVNAMGLNAGLSNSFSNISLFGNGAAASANNQLAFSNSTGFNAQISNTNLTADRKFELPDQAGTIALLSDITSSSVQSTVVTLNNAAIISGIPMEVLPAPGPGLFIDVLSVKTVFTPGITGLASAYCFGTLGYGTFNIASITGTPLVINNTSWFAALPITAGINVQSPFVVNNPVCLYLNTTMSGGVGNEIKVYITYQIVTI